jgi:hypothetical protein
MTGLSSRNDVGEGLLNKILIRKKVFVKEGAELRWIYIKHL